MEEIKSLKDISFNELSETFNEAFKNYEIQLTKSQLQKMLVRRGFDPELSFGAFTDGRLVSFTFNGTGTFNGMKTAYDTGTGTVPEFQGKGYANKVFLFSLPVLKESGIGQYLLEVLQHNTKAVQLYRKNGFEVTREFYYFSKKNEDIELCTKKTASDFLVCRIDPDQLPEFSSFFDFNPSWQNSFEAIFRQQSEFNATGVFDGTILAGFCISDPGTGDVTQIAVDRKYRRKGIGTLLLRKMVEMNDYGSLKIVNTESACTSINEFLRANSFEPRGKQFEMILKL